MNAVVSGRAGVALLLDDEGFSSLHAGSPDLVVRRRAEEIHLLFGGARDLQFLEGIEVEEAKLLLDRATRGTDALQLALDVLDGTLSIEARWETAVELDELLGSVDVEDFLKRVLYAHPLTADADLPGARACSAGSAPRADALFCDLQEHQPAITAVHRAWEQIPDRFFDSAEDRAAARSVLLREGMFLQLVERVAREDLFEDLVAVALTSPKIRALPDPEVLLRQWVQPLEPSDRNRPYPVSVGLESLVAEPHTDVRPPATAIKILFLGADPLGTTQLRLDQEVREIDGALSKSDSRDRFTLIQQWPVRTPDLQSFLLQHRPNIVHFSGHGEAGIVFLEPESGQARLIDGGALGSLLSVQGNLRCVVLNACYSAPQAEEIARRGGAVIALPNSLGNRAAIAFSSAFYQALAAGESVAQAFETGRVRLSLEGGSPEDQPRLITSAEDPQEIRFAG